MSAISCANCAAVKNKSLHAARLENNKKKALIFNTSPSLKQQIYKRQLQKRASRRLRPQVKFETEIEISEFKHLVRDNDKRQK